ncbi:MAG: pantoate--beta-alanine ligase [candidate division Zixibacteria bacterium]|nr:pantoate--beta-alanine ligase [candidate division Zixibacteria bacterium]
MKLVTSVSQMQKLSQTLRRRGKKIGLVPTMGFLHEGHLSLVRIARKKSDVVVVSIFVNPTQFGPQEDFEKYPRNLAQDKKLLAREKCDILFYPSVGDIYPENYLTYVEVKDITEVLEGAFRSGHFQGVVTVVTKLFNIVQPDVAVFGQKDAQQLVAIRKMASDLNFAAKILTGKTVRDKEGLALSSRNSYLTDEQKIQAQCLRQALMKGKSLIQEGQRDSQKIINSMQEVIRRQKNADIDYIAVSDAESLQPLGKISGRVLISLAVKFGQTRLIDNICLQAGKKVSEVTC